MISAAAAETTPEKLWRNWTLPGRSSDAAENASKFLRFSAAKLAVRHEVNCYTFETLASLSRKLLVVYYYHH